MHRIRNFTELAATPLRANALAIAEAGYGAVNVGAALARDLRVENGALRVGEKEYALTNRRVYFVGIGKCAFAAAQAIEKILGDSLTAGIAFGIGDMPERSASIEFHSGTHPLPSAVNVAAANRLLTLLSGREETDLVLMLISGGGSTLLCAPHDPMTCVDESALFHTLTDHGASIQELNTVRKHISRARGGGLAVASYPAEVVSLIVSDVPGDDIEYISSGPTLLDSSTVADARAVLEKYGVPTIAPLTLVETEKEQKYFDRVTNLLFLTNKNALAAMQTEAAARGYAAEIVDDKIEGEAREVGRTIAERLHAAESKTAFLYAGETTVTVGGVGGAGGRNQEMALAALADIAEGELILACASDGHDNTDHAGAIGDAVTRTHAHEQNLSIPEYLAAHRSYDFFAATGDALITGYTGSNVSDFIIALKK
ncbi:DUF4147 domain-containing protein [Patescibacteria group bacterium]|nr:DUF4147 domain-containing protein [Patescibacteria group bacterium]